MFSQILKSYRSSGITKADKHFAKTLDFKDINFPVKIRDIHKIEPKNSIDISVFGYENKEKQPNYVSKKMLRRKTEKKHYVLINDFNRFMYDHSLHRVAKENIFVVIIYMLSLQKKF